MYHIIDIGGTFIKIYNSDTKIIKRIEISDNNILELNLLKNVIKSNIESTCEKIYLSCQMHGFILYDDGTNISEFITWKKISKYNYLEKIIDNNKFKNITGLNCRIDLPINNIYEYFKENNISNKTIYVKNISEAILDYDFSKTHITMACGNGFLDINNICYYDEFIRFFLDEFNIDLKFDKPINEIIINGYITFNNKNIPVYCGLGDFQVSNVDIKKDELYINMATGSQMSLLTNNINYTKEINYRLFFNNNYLKCITHIPSGRFLNIFKNLFCDLFDIDITVNDIINSDIVIDTDIFKDNLSINNIKNNNFTKKNLISSIYRCYLDQYVDIYNKYFSYEIINRIVLSGGIPKKNSFISEYLSIKLNKKIFLKSNFDDDSIYGIIKLIE